jgi:hypothetical protein
MVKSAVSYAPMKRQPDEECYDMSCCRFRLKEFDIARTVVFRGINSLYCYLWKVTLSGSLLDNINSIISISLIQKVLANRNSMNILAGLFHSYPRAAAVAEVHPLCHPAYVTLCVRSLTEELSYVIMNNLPIV